MRIVVRALRSIALDPLLQPLQKDIESEVGGVLSRPLHDLPRCRERLLVLARQVVDCRALPIEDVVNRQRHRFGDGSAAARSVSWTAASPGALF